MTYQEARVYLDEVSKYGSVLGLDVIRNLLAELGNPQEDLYFIHIAGTNGKGSVLAYTSTVLSEAGYRTGRYISPSVTSYLERIQVDAEWISEDAFAELTEVVKDAALRLQAKGENGPTVFEIETAIAFLYFKRQNCDLVVLETGLGGLEDATNIVRNTVAAVFAQVSRDHMSVLGSSLQEIAKQKAGIIKPGCSVVTLPQKAPVRAVLEEEAQKYKCPVYEADIRQIQRGMMDAWGQEFSYRETGMIHLSLSGTFQAENAALACEVIHALRDKGYLVTDEALRKGLEGTRWPGRFSCIGRDPLFLVDGAHNEDAAMRLKESIESCFPGRKLIGIMGVYRDKEYEKIAAIVASMADCIYTVDLPDKERTLSAGKLKTVAEKYCRKAEAAGDIKTAVEKAYQEAGKEDVILAFGSLSYLGQVKQIVETRKKIPDMDREKIRQGIRLLLEGIGEDINREGLRETPERIARMYEEIYGGMRQNAEEHLTKTFHTDNNEMVVEKDITFYSTCEHHMLPFYGKAHIAYIPNGEVVGLSKLARTVEVYAKRLQIQEQLTAQIADALMEYLRPKGVMVMLEAEHLCMTMRGIKKPGSRTVTVVKRGAFLEEEKLTDLFFQMVNR